MIRIIKFDMYEILITHDLLAQPDVNAWKKLLKKVAGMDDVS